ncbi:hypothetical protein CYLTODRAFT_347512 [Cylindrobasidium torrendii FP15055 ss-10]|uniref:histidine kinase n=1 Tax=Cylindrobasidium torrendii FP15055 ss-10 TaxID=1314674 RepID=A0A0D7BJW9_9AGAR|nr:hypothetical protein CYLTODRAFT_347512 [Cylindrobasidium torrendii FP15055 ss-10]
MDDPCDEDEIEPRYHRTPVPGSGFWGSCKTIAVFWYGLLSFFDPSFQNPEHEREYQREVWANGRALSIFASLFFVVTWVMAIASIQKPTVLADQIFYFGVASVLTVPLAVFCYFDYPLKYPKLYQTFICASTWSWASYQVLYQFFCKYYTADDGSHLFTCGTKDFVSTFYYASAMQTVALFGGHLGRISATVGASVFITFSSALIMPYRSAWYRNIINFLVFQSFLLYMHFQLDMVRVPLNTALLAAQNMRASGVVGKGSHIEFEALEGSLTQMSKGAVATHYSNRMDSGKFEVLNRPYPFHQVIQSLMLPLDLSTSAHDQSLHVHLDPRIDEYALRAQHLTLGKSSDEVDLMLKDRGDLPAGIVCGDENRLRQIVTNLASNAVKFNGKGGTLTVRTQLVEPATSSCSTPNDKSSDSTLVNARPYSVALAKSESQQDLERIIVRIEVSDTGVGISPRAYADASIFSAFIQTDLGKTQGGKGTGLGLALVRRIVKLSGGRLGLYSRRGHGSTFWVELPLGVGSQVIQPSPMEECHALGPDITPNTFALAPILSHDSDSLQRKRLEHERAEIIALRQSRRSPSLTRSPAALRGLMNAEGPVELHLASHNPTASAPTRTIGDPSTGTEYAHDIRVQVETITEPEQAAIAHPRPNYITLPSPQLFTLDNALPPSVSAPVGQSFSRGGTSPRGGISSPGSFLFDRCQVLVVDDDKLTRLLMKRMLERLGCSVTVAENGQVALNILLGLVQTPSSDRSVPVLEHRLSESVSPRVFTAIFLDNQMPLMSGLQLVAKLRELQRTDFVVGVTGNALRQDQEEYLSAGADNVLAKPVMEGSLTAMLAEGERRRRMRDSSAPSTPS